MSRWKHVPLQELVQDAGIPLKQQGRDPEGDPAYVGVHTNKHDSKSGTSLAVWDSLGMVYCRSCKFKGDVADLLVDVGKIGDRIIYDRQDAIIYLTERYGPPPHEWQKPIPSPDFHGPSFPLSVLPEPLRSFAQEDAGALQVPLDLTGALSISIASAAASVRASVEVKAGWWEPVNTYFVPVLDSGEGKSPALRDAAEPLEQIEEELVKAAQEEIEMLQIERTIVEAELQSKKRELTKAKEDQKNELKDQVPRPRPGTQRLPYSSSPASDVR